IRAKLHSTAFQKGLLWRQEKIEAIAYVRKKGMSEQEIFKELKISGLTTPTANALIEDSRYLDGLSEDGLTEDDIQEELEEENEKRAQLGKPRVSFEEWKKMRVKRKKPVEG
ncbi:MAG TPA: hypothetical protein VK487_01940, partial [Candidatus Bathyarchaeia archaeon]|nr:hypothetical protein [Candidatus Bathyarchaeia archaeon]